VFAVIAAILFRNFALLVDLLGAQHRADLRTSGTLSLAGFLLHRPCHLAGRGPPGTAGPVGATAAAVYARR